MTSDPPTRSTILGAAKDALVENGYSALSTRNIAQRAGVPLSQIHYHFGTKQNLVLEVLEEENRRLLQRQARLYEADMPFWKQWEQACDFLDDDLASGYVRVLQEMTAAGWGDDEIAAAVRANMRGWMDLLTDTAARASQRLGGLGPFTPEEVAVLAGSPFLGVEALILLGFEEGDLPMRSALRKVGDVLRGLEE
ncbi:MAG TPA: TetR/AcrR family transcriptional regulator [Acidimicrobiia bacterium]|nr:TetR/AcrR family transcriptional regulator [Acidimicrobiia bacterium]